MYNVFMKGQPCTINGVHYESMNTAAKVLGVSIATVRHRLQSPNFPRYVSKYHPKKKLRKAPDRGYPCIIEGVHYKSEHEAAKDLKTDVANVINRLQSSNSPGYISKHYPKKSRRQYVRSKKPYKNGRCPCTINGVKYESIKVAAKALGMHTNGLRIRLASSNFPDYICKYLPKKKTRVPVLIPCVIKGVEYDSIRVAAKKLGKDPGSIIRRLRSFDYPDYVCDEYPKDKSIKFYKYEVRGKRYKTLEEIAAMEGLTRERIRQKMNSKKHTEYQRL